MNWWVLYGRKTLANRRDSKKYGWTTSEEAWNFIRGRLAQGNRVIQLAGPDGQEFNEYQILKVLTDRPSQTSTPR
jgi:hypothetical protein